jgi:hypothetical protein
MDHLREEWRKIAWGEGDSLPGSLKKKAGKSLKDMSRSEFSEMRVVYHGTSDRRDLDTLLEDGVKMSNTPMNISRQRYQKGEYAEYQPGAGIGMGLYVSGSAYTASEYGRHVIAIEVTDADLAVPPESTVPGGTVAEALKDHNGAIIIRDIAASKVHLVAKDLERYILGDVWDTAQKVGAKITGPDGDGDCYEVAGKYILDHALGREDEYQLCHGMVTGQGDVAGIRFGHAWVERKVGANWVVIDHSNGLDVTDFNRAMYYLIGKITREGVNYYTPSEATEYMRETRHWGPWE